MKIIRPAIRWSAAVVAVMTLVVWAVGQFFRDCRPLFGLMFYAPSPALAAAYLMAALVCWKRRSRHQWLYLGLLLPPVLSIVFVENHWRVPAKLADGKSVLPDQVLTLVHWNICRPVERWPVQRDMILELNPDVMVLSEITAEIQDSDFPGYQVYRQHPLLIACRGSLKWSDRLIPDRSLHCYLVECGLSSGPLNIIMADMTSGVRVWRDPLLRKLNDAMSAHQADIVVGDLNSPRLSLALQSLPTGYRHAYDEAGSGWGYTWPVPVPALAIDQCICGPKISPVRYELRSSVYSDHRMQILEFVRRSEEQALQFSPVAVDQ